MLVAKHQPFFETGDAQQGVGPRLGLHDEELGDIFGQIH
jgi:hypothetical protein